MTNPILERIEENLEALKLYRTRDHLETILEQAGVDNLSYADFLDQLLLNERSLKQERQHALYTALAKMPYIKKLEDYDYCFRASIDQRVITELASYLYIERTENVILLGPPGTGKTHIAIALGMKAIA